MVYLGGVTQNSYSKAKTNPLSSSDISPLHWESNHKKGQTNKMQNKLMKVSKSKHIFKRNISNFHGHEEKFENLKWK